MASAVTKSDMRQLHLTEEAIADLREISRYIAQDDPATANGVIERIEESIEAVQMFPGLGKPARKAGILVYGGSKNQPFRFTYRLVAQRFEVMRVFRGSRNGVQF